MQTNTTGRKGLESISSMELAQTIKKDCLLLTHKADASHIGGALSVADILAVLYKSVIQFNPRDPTWEERDRIIFSKGHSCTALYSVLKEVGFFHPTDLDHFSENGSFFTTHINHKIPGVEFSTGSLGHGLPFACGIALAGKRKHKNFRVFAVLSDGELDEGSNWEAFLFAPQHHLDNLVVIIDYNKIQSLGTVKEVIDLNPLQEKFLAFKWAVREIDGHDHMQLIDAFKSLPFKQGKPTVIIAHTIKGKGVDFMENTLVWHYRSPNKEQLEEALRQIENKR